MPTEPHQLTEKALKLDELTTPDAPTDNWVDRFAPDFSKPFLRLMRADRPIGIWLLLIPCLWGSALGLVQIGNSIASGETAGMAIKTDTVTASWSMAFWHGVLFTIGATVMRGAGCTYNDIIDRDIDANVARTAKRPIPSGQVSIKSAWVFLVLQCLIGLAVLLQFNKPTVFLGLASLFLVAVYPFMKRITWWPQVWLGLTFNWGALVGYSAAMQEIQLSAVLIYLAGIFWTVGYDTVYAHQDIDDDALIGVKSSARRLGSATLPALCIFYAITIICFIAVGLIARHSFLFFLALIAPAAHLGWQLRAFRTKDSSKALAIFKSNRDAGLLLLAPLLLEAIAK
ncbi:MAG: 4-hydroxybenzoate octaprenyltransferase [Pseudomonadota bacterium]